jgi:hypothetical protein
MPSFVRASAPAIVGAMLLAGCGGGSSSHATASTVSPSAYVTSVCSAMGSFVDASYALPKPAPNIPPAQSKKALQAFMSGAVRNADELVASLKRAGTPNVRDGESSASTIVGAWTQVASAFRQAQSAFKLLDTSNAAAFKSGVRSAQATMNNAVSRALSNSNWRDADLVGAAKNSAACRSLAR